MMLNMPVSLSQHLSGLQRVLLSGLWISFPVLTPLPKVSLLIAFICVRSSVWTSYSAYSYFEVVTVCNLIMILAFYLVHLFRLYRALTCISWPLSELLHYLIGTLLLLIASIVAASRSYSHSGLVAGAVRTLPGRLQERILVPSAHFLLMGQQRACSPGSVFLRISTHLDRPAAVSKEP
ncbi:CKLF-like MARVEL transmembrane domain-containing protein 7 isoform X1 [Camelus dromedarius]|uniref:CKLF-like MARVEL transmembrane domain-containing protein 7 isoform X1 n=1 Tax=Camelus dromedarius TaxID=9838 RepID=UPI00311A9088